MCLEAVKEQIDIKYRFIRFIQFRCFTMYSVVCKVVSCVPDLGNPIPTTTVINHARASEKSNICYGLLKFIF